MTAKQKAESLLEYIKQHPQERFWQALRNWSGYDYILGGKYFGGGETTTDDTFYLED